ncbi:hypothetical protein F4808DRAFT_464886 [Astrocystis sublimbata]|nr:hypothetical protein F4808DRAFT_464886 [Astrocystis sublimbata]
MRLLSLSAATAFLALSSSALVSANTNAEAKPDTTPDNAPTTTATTTSTQKTKTSTPNLMMSLYKLAGTFNLRACIPAALPLVTSLPKIPPGLLGGDVVSQALTQTTRGIEGVCDFSITGESGEVFTSFLPDWYAWYEENREKIAKVVSKCREAEGLVRTVEAYKGCEVVRGVRGLGVETGEVVTGTGMETGAGTETAAAAETEETGDSHPAEGSMEMPGTPGETMFLDAAAAVAAGVMGVAAALD